MEKTELASRSQAFRIGYAGMLVFIASLSVLFAATAIGFIIVRSRIRATELIETTPLPFGLWISTALIILSSFTIHLALQAVRRESRVLLKTLLMITLLLGLGFLVSQLINWVQLVRAGITAKSNLYGFTFYLLTGLHGAHVLGGLFPLSVVTAKSFRGLYSSTNHAGIVYTSIYWHFLDVVWVLIFIALLIFW